jgi:hypothetical protein
MNEHHCKEMDIAIQNRAIEKWGTNGYQLAYLSRFEETEFMQISFCPFCGISLANNAVVQEVGTIT